MSIQNIYDKLKPYFPFSQKADDVIGLIISILIYAILPVVLGFVTGLVAGIPVLSAIVAIIMTLVDLYCLVGIVLAVLIFLKVVE